MGAPLPWETSARTESGAGTGQAAAAAAVVTTFCFQGCPEVSAQAFSDKIQNLPPLTGEVLSMLDNGSQGSMCFVGVLKLASHRVLM